MRAQRANKRQQRREVSERETHALDNAYSHL